MVIHLHAMSSRIVLMRLVWSVALLATLLLFAFALAALLPGQNAGEIASSIWQNAAGEILFSPSRDGGLTRAGIYTGDVLVAINDQPVTSLAEAKILLNRTTGSAVTLTVRTGNFPLRRVTVVPATDTRQVLDTIGLSGETSARVQLAANVLFAIICTSIALVIAWKKWNDWFALLVSMTIVVVLLGASLPVILFYQANASWQAMLNIWFMFAFTLLLGFFYLFPTGQFVPRQTRWLLAALAVWTVIGILNPALYPWQISSLLYALVLVGGIGTGIVAQATRYRSLASTEEKQQIRWVVFGAAAAALGIVLQILPRTIGLNLTGAWDVLYGLVLYPVGFLLVLLLPLSIAFAILRYRLWDIDVVVNRTLVYGTLTLSIVAFYALGVSLLGALFQTTNNLFVSLLMTAIIAVAFQPLRERLQRGVNRLMYGQRDEPYAVVTQLGKRVEATPAPDAMLPALVETIAQALKLPYVAIETGAGENARLAAAYGNAPSRVVRLPMQYQTETVGHLLVAPRRADETLSATDLNLLATVAQQTGAAVHAVQLTSDLQRSRERLVMAREEERRRIRRDLHDGLGPALAALAMEADTARVFVRRDAARAEQLLDEIIAKAQNAVQDVRRLVYNLRPPALDELGLVGALNQHIASMSGQMQLTFHAPDALPPLPAAVEVAAYRIAQEALNNVVRHTHAQHCTLRLESNHALELEICDDGQGIPPDARSGVGLLSMRERAAELGGTCVIESLPEGGTRVLARLPLNQN
jgi:signal transduction histidine kinase